MASKRFYPSPVSVRCTAEELEQLKALADAYGITLSALFRDAVLAERQAPRKRKTRQPVKNKKALAKMAAMLGQSRKGLAGLWDKMRGEHARIRKQNEMEAFFALQRDREQRHRLVMAQLQERQRLQQDIRAARTRHAAQLKSLHRDAANYRLMQRGEAPKLDRELDKAKIGGPAPQERLEALRAQPSSVKQTSRQLTPQERLAKLRESPRRDPRTRDRGHEPDMER